MFAMNVTAVPEQIVELAGLLVMLTVGLADELTFIVIVLLTAAAGVAQASEEVIWQLTTLPFASVELVNVLLLVPAFELLTSH